MNDRPEDAGHGALFKNTKKEKPSQPEFTGDVTIHGKKFWASGWRKEGQKGAYLSLAFRRADEEKPAAKSVAKGPASTEEELF